MLSVSTNKQKSAYIDFVSRGEPEEIARFYSLKNLPSIMGGDYFKEWVKEKFSDLNGRGEIPESRSLASTPEKIMALVCDHFKVDREYLTVSRRGTENVPRDVAIYLVRRYSGETLAEIGRHFSIANYSTVSTAVERIKARKGKDRNLLKQLEEIGKRLNKSQRQI